MTDNGAFVSSSLEGYSRDLVKVNRRIRDLTAAQEARKIGHGMRDWETENREITLMDGSSGRRDSREKRARMQDQALVSREPVFCVAQ